MYTVLRLVCFTVNSTLFNIISFGIKSIWLCIIMLGIMVELLLHNIKTSLVMHLHSAND